MKNFNYTIDESRNGFFYTATPIDQKEYGFYCTDTNGNGLFLVTLDENKQLVGRCDFHAKNLNSFKYQLTKYLKKIKNN